MAIVDGFASDPQALRAIAAGRTFVADAGHYPGVKAPVTRAWFEATSQTMGAVLRDVFGATGEVSVLGAWYQIVSKPPAKLSLEQRVPHFDAIEPGRIAIVHYLSEDYRGGTAFYRHRSTGYETVSAARAPGYFARLNAEIAAHGPPPPAYLDGSSDLFERTALIEPKFNRAILYRSHLLHSGAIPADADLSADPSSGRLTVGVFLAL